MMGLDIDTEGGSEDMPSKKEYMWSWIHVWVHPRTMVSPFLPRSSLSRKQVSSILGFLSGLTIMYGPRNLMGTAVFLRRGECESIGGVDVASDLKK